MPRSGSETSRSRSRSRTRNRERTRSRKHHHRRRSGSRHRHRSRSPSHHHRRDNTSVTYPPNAPLPNYQLPYPNVPYPNPYYSPYRNPYSQPLLQPSYPPSQVPYVPPPPPHAGIGQNAGETDRYEPAQLPDPPPIHPDPNNALQVIADVPQPIMSTPTVVPSTLSPQTKDEPQSTLTEESVNVKSYTQPHLMGLSLMDGRKEAYEKCRATVERLAKHCKAKNRKFRDIEFDIENDTVLCLDNLNSDVLEAPDIQRVPDIFPSSRVFYSGTPKSAEVIEGILPDGHLISALSAMTSVEGLVESFCVARDENVGIYGFIFHRDCYWVPVIIDDLLFTRFPKYEELTASEKQLYNYEKDHFNETTKISSESLFFARPPAKGGETWMPLVEKAYAKLHGDYASIRWGKTSDALEDLTGGISNVVLTKDILDPDRFWNSELIFANKDRLFGCCFTVLNGTSSGQANPAVHGLLGGLSYSVVRAAEVQGKRFVVMRSPWGHFGGTWKGPWSDGSKEWTSEWLACLNEIKYSLGGEGGEFVMEYKDFLNVWEEIQRTTIFDDSWIMSSLWLHTSLSVPNMKAFSFGDITFTFSLPVTSPIILVLSKYDTRYFCDIRGHRSWNFDFVLAKLGSDGVSNSDIIAESSYADFYGRSVSVELEMLEKGEYIVLTRIDSSPNLDKNYFKNGLKDGWNKRKLLRIMTERAKGQSIAANYKPEPSLLPIASSSILENKKSMALDRKILDTALKSPDSGGQKGTDPESLDKGEAITVTTKTITTTVISKEASIRNAADAGIMTVRSGSALNSNPSHILSGGLPMSRIPITPYAPPAPLPLLDPTKSDPTLPPPPSSLLTLPAKEDYVLEDDDSMVFGLKVYTKKDARVTICGRLSSDITGVS